VSSVGMGVRQIDGGLKFYSGSPEVPVPVLRGNVAGGHVIRDVVSPSLISSNTLLSSATFFPVIPQQEMPLREVSVVFDKKGSESPQGSELEISRLFPRYDIEETSTGMPILKLVETTVFTEKDVKVQRDSSVLVSDAVTHFEAERLPVAGPLTKAESNAEARRIDDICKEDRERIDKLYQGGEDKKV